MLWQLGGVRALDAATHQVDYAVRSARVLARAGVTLTRLPTTSPPELTAALRLTVIDLLRGAGVADVEILARVDEALGLPPG